MTLPNRMTPFGVPAADPARGLFMGNRGCLVDRHGRHARAWRGERWITCVLEFKGRRRAPLMAPGRYTELFFLDEATAVAAGHRPCAECRRADLQAFRAAWLEVHPGDAGSLTVLDGRLHAERTAAARRIAPARSLPEGTMVALEGAAWLVVDGALRAWSHGGYGERRELPDGAVEVLTPPSSVAVLARGWRPVLHPSARQPVGTLPASG
jgi:hypothetical protein